MQNKTKKYSLTIKTFSKYIMNGVALGLIGAVFFVGAVHAQICNITMPTIEYSNTLSEIRYDRDHTVEELQAIHTNYSGSHLLGLAGGKIGAEVYADIDARKMSQQQYCMNLSRIQIDFYAKPELYIARNFARGSCEYNAVLKHEYMHIDILKAAHKEFYEGFKQHVTQIIQNRPNVEHVMSEDIYKAKDFLLNSIGRDINLHLDTLREEIGSRQQEIDTMQNYHDILSKCKNWGEKLQE